MQYVQRGDCMRLVGFLRCDDGDVLAELLALSMISSCSCR